MIHNEEKQNRLTEMIKSTNGRLAYSTCEDIAFKLMYEGVVVPPCKLKDTVYILLENGWIGEYEVKALVDACGKGVILSGPKGWFGRWEGLDCDYDEWGVTIFPTREEAEKALKETD